MSFEGKISGSLAPRGAKVGSVSGSIGAVVPDIRDGVVTTAKLADEAVTTAKLADAAVTIAKLAQDVTALINSKGDATDVAALQSDVAALQTITEGLGTASTYGVANNLTTAAAGTDVLDAYQGKVLSDSLKPAPFTHSGYLGSGDDLDTVGAGVYYCTNAVANIPVSTGGFVLTAYRTNNAKAQLFLPAASGYVNSIFKRQYVYSSASWTVWARFNGTEDAKYQGTTVNGVTWYAARIGKVFTLTAVNGETTNAVNANAAIISLSGFPNVFTNDETVLSPCETVDSISSVRLKINNNSRMVYSSSAVSAGTTIRAQIVGILT